MTKIRTQADAEYDLKTVSVGRLAGSRRLTVRMDMVELKDKRLAADLLSHRAAAVKACVNCKGLHVDEQNFPDTFVREFRLKCGREKPGMMLTCDDGVRVFVDKDKELKSSYMGSKAAASSNWASLILGESFAPIPGRRITSMVCDELTYFDPDDTHHFEVMERKKKEEIERKLKEKDTPKQADSQAEVW